jgi:hypothetical protein
MARAASLSELFELLRTHSGTIRQMLGEPDAQLSVPTDGKGLRVLAEIPGFVGGPRHIKITYKLRGREIEVPIEISTGYENYILSCTG